MMRAVAMVLVLAGVALADPKPEMSPAETAKWLGFFDKLVDAVVADGTACDKLASHVCALIDANQDALAVARRAKAAGKKLPLAAQQRMLDGVKKMVPAMQACGQRDNVRAAFGKLAL